MKQSKPSQGASWASVVWLVVGVICGVSSNSTGETMAFSIAMFFVGVEFVCKAIEGLDR